MCSSSVLLVPAMILHGINSYKHILRTKKSSTHLYQCENCKIKCLNMYICVYIYRCVSVHTTCKYIYIEIEYRLKIQQVNYILVQTNH